MGLLNTQLIIQIRKEKKVTQARLARLIYVDSTVMCKIEKGIAKRIPFEVIGRIAEVLEIDLNMLYIKIERKIDPDDC